MKQLDLYESEKQEWLRKARMTAVEIALKDGRVSADELREKFPIPAHINKNIMGQVFQHPDFCWNGIKKSTTGSRKRSLISVWVLKNEIRERLMPVRDRMG